MLAGMDKPQGEGPPRWWRVSKKGHRYPVIDQLVTCVVIERTERGVLDVGNPLAGGRHPIRSKWTFPQQGDTFNEALDAVIALA